MPRPRKIVDCNDLEKRINAYFDGVDAYNSNPDNVIKKFYTWADLLLYLGVHQSTVDMWINNTETYIGYKDCILTAQLRLQAQIEQMGLQDGKKTGIVAFMLKQKHYGGYTDKPISAADSINVNVNLQGMGHKDAFG